MTADSPILHQFQTGNIDNAGLHERIGVFALKTAAIMTKPIEYVGFSKAAALVRTFLPSNNPIQTTLFEDTLFEYPYGDGYWSRLVYNGDVYSRQEEDFLKSLKDVDYAFIDCGANYGYMSSIVTSKTFGQKPAISIEADPNTFSILQRNAALNNNRFEIRHNAVFSKSGEMVNIHGHKHEARSILNAEGKHSDGNVETLALNDLEPWVKKQKTDRLIIKLDVEGVEIDALKGAENLLSYKTLVMYEDHAKDKSSEVSDYVMTELGLAVYFSGPGGCRKIKSIDEVKKIKTNSHIGYDFVATNDEDWVKDIKIV